ncbi:helix-hairpin-helix domain-containing protein [Alicyclobacillus fodiniaquatilis]|jgi:hypothetical protein|uniref:Helix-hairpin-helix domain-containing protein n=1 Tax=Alicyclobacillus fodiniaquatilis TaxID=1661150 RepID=A0ABW4JPM8_9BACL
MAAASPKLPLSDEERTKLSDTLRCIVHHANHPDSEKSWFAFTEERKRYRQQFGYPDTRPSRAWHEV